MVKNNLSSQPLNTTITNRTTTISTQFCSTIFKFYLQHHYQPNPLPHHHNTINALPRKLQFLKISIMDSTTALAYQHLLFLHVSPATIFSTPTLYPLYHVKMDDNKTKTLCNICHHYSICYSYTYAATACHQSISINTHTFTISCHHDCSISIIVPHTHYVLTPHYN